MKKLSILIAAGLVACGGTSRPERFEPAERATAESPQGYTAAEYELTTRKGDLGDVKVWSPGARIMEVNGVNRTVVHVGFEVDNSSNQPIDLEDLALDQATLHRQIVSGVQPARIDGATTVQPGRVNEINAYFPLPAGVSPQQVNAFRIRWRIHSPDVVYSQHTPFIQNPGEAVAYYYTPYYDPFYYDWYFYQPRIVVHRYPYRHYHRYR
jgi:hypothetical protein